MEVRIYMDKELQSLLKSFIPGAILVLVLWLIKLLEMKSGFLLTEYGVLPRTVEGLKGVITSPLIHGDYKHLISNSVPLLVLGAGLVYFYQSLAFRVFLLVYLLGGFWLWLGGRESYHIGASGIVYGLTSFLFFSGVFRRDTRLMALSLLVVFLYGGMIWGIFPLFIGMSWEAHLFGGLAGLLISFVYRGEGPQRKVYTWEDETEEVEDETLIPEEEIETPELPAPNQETKINYIYTPTPRTPDDEKN